MLVQNICNSEIPVMIGIGHEADSTVLDEICTKRFDTPSKVINYIINTIVDKAKTAEYNYGSYIGFRMPFDTTMSMMMGYIFSSTYSINFSNDNVKQITTYTCKHIWRDYGSIS